MAVREDTITELTVADIKKWGDQLTEARECQNNAERADKKCRHDQNKIWRIPAWNAVWVRRSDYADGRIERRVDKIEPLELEDTWTFKPPEQPEAYDPAIDGKTASVKSAKMEAAWETRRQDHKIYLSVKDEMKQLIVKAYTPCWLEEIEDDILEFTVKSAK